MVIENVRYAIPEDRRREFEAAYGRAQASLAASGQCPGYDLSVCAEDRGAYVLRIEWDSADGHLRGFRSGPEFRPFLAEVGPFVGFVVEMRHYEPTPVRMRK